MKLFIYVQLLSNWLQISTYCAHVTRHSPPTHKWCAVTAASLAHTQCSSASRSYSTNIKIIIKKIMMLRINKCANSKYIAYLYISISSKYIIKILQVSKLKQGIAHKVLFWQKNHHLNADTEHQWCSDIIIHFAMIPMLLEFNKNVYGFTWAYFEFWYRAVFICSWAVLSG